VNCPKSGGRQRLVLLKKYNQMSVYLLLKISPKSVKLFQGYTELEKVQSGDQIGNLQTLVTGG